MQNISGKAIFIFLLILSTGCDKNGPKIMGSGNLIVENRTLHEFDEIHISGLIRSTISYGSQASLSIRADDNILPRVKTIVNNGVLTISLEICSNFVANQRTYLD